jgi:hypothetical protein
MIPRPEGFVGRLVVAAVAAGAVTAIAGALLIAMMTRSNLRVETAQRNAAVTEALAARFDTRVANELATLAIIANTGAVTELGEEAGVELRAALRASRLFDEIMLIDADGTPVRVSSPDRVIFPDAKITKGQLADYYRAVGPLMLVWTGGRPISLARAICPAICPAVSMVSGKLPTRKSTADRKNSPMMPGGISGMTRSSPASGVRPTCSRMASFPSCCSAPNMAAACIFGTCIIASTCRRSTSARWLGRFWPRGAAPPRVGWWWN